MAYVAVKGGRNAIEHSRDLYRYEHSKGDSAPITVDQIREQMHLSVDKVMSEGGIYAPEMAALAIKQSAGDLYEAAFMVRAYSATHPRLDYSVPQSTEKMRIIRRISAAFKNIPGGQILGPTSDYRLRILDFDLCEQSADAHKDYVADLLERVDLGGRLPDTFPKVVDILRQEGLLVPRSEKKTDGEIADITREALRFPASRSASLQSMARGETGGLLALAYSVMRGYGMVHPTIGELRVGYLPLRVTHPYTGEVDTIGEVKVTEAEVVMCCMEKCDEKPRFQLGYGLCFGHNEIKAISMAMLDQSMRADAPAAPAEDQEFVLTHVDGIESMGFCVHFKLPHYVTFQSELDRLRKSREKHETE